MQETETIALSLFRPSDEYNSEAITGGVGDFPSRNEPDSAGAYRSVQ